MAFIEAKAIILESKKNFKVDVVKVPTDLHPDDVLVKMVATGICHTGEQFSGLLTI